METQGNQAKAQATYEWTAQPFSPCKPSGFSPSLLQIFSSIWKPLSNDRSDNNRWDGTFSISVIVVAAIAGEWFPYDRYDPCDSWTFFLSDRSKNTYTTLTEWDDLSLDRQCDPSQSWVLRKWNSSNNKCVDTIWFSKPTTTTNKM